MRGIHAFTNIFDHDITNVVHHIGVVTQAANHGVGACATIQSIGSAIAGQRVTQAVARTVDRSISCQDQVLNVGAQGVVDTRQHQIGPGARSFSDHIRDIVNHVTVVTQAANHRVGACAAVQHVGRAIAGQLVVQRIARTIQRGDAGEGQIFHVRAEGVADT